MKIITRLALLLVVCNCEYQLVAQVCVNCYGGSTFNITEITGECQGHSAFGIADDSEAFCDSGHFLETHYESISWEECGQIGWCTTTSTVCI